MDTLFFEQWIDAHRVQFEEIAADIWDCPEICYKEYHSAKLQKEFLSVAGFRVRDSVAGIETAFVAEWGNGGPVIGLLGEFDALPQLSQQCDVTEKSPIEPLGNGHGCGHHLLGTGAMEAACMIRDYLEKNAIPGTIRYYGCPAEEGGGGKVFMLRSGCWNDVDVCLSWHPGPESYIWNSNLANARVKFNFHGISAHAGVAPHLGRSALDAVELMNVGANYLREHIIDAARIHYAVTNTGGQVPNVVQAEAEVVYAVRAPKITEVSEIIERVIHVAEGAALMTGTTMEYQIVSAYANYISNDTLSEIMEKHAKEFLPISYTSEELAYARKFLKSDDRDKKETPICSELQSVRGRIPFSTDVGDVSWCVPTCAMQVCCFSRDTQLHNWIAVAQGKATVAYKGMHAAAEILAASAAEIFEDPDILHRVRTDFENALGKDSYQSLLPEKR